MAAETYIYWKREMHLRGKVMRDFFHGLKGDSEEIKKYRILYKTIKGHPCVEISNTESGDVFVGKLTCVNEDCQNVNISKHCNALGYIMCASCVKKSKSIAKLVKDNKFKECSDSYCKVCRRSRHYLNSEIAESYKALDIRKINDVNDTSLMKFTYKENYEVIGPMMRIENIFDNTYAIIRFVCNNSNCNNVSNDDRYGLSVPFICKSCTKNSEIYEHYKKLVETTYKKASDTHE